MEQQLINEIEHCDLIIKHHSDYLEVSQKKKQLFIELQNLILEKEPEAVDSDVSSRCSCCCPSCRRPFRESQFFHDVDEKTHLILNSEGNTIMSREGSCDDCFLDDDASITSNAENCLLEEIDGLKNDFYDFKTRMDKAIAKIDKGFEHINGGCRASI